ncbi:MAG: peptidylprolyl isomerase [Deltaproteobacteria bacterium]|nr:peptidylprolyl isomerase [Deltaproteobacteria bacterium]
MACSESKRASSPDAFVVTPKELTLAEATEGIGGAGELCFEIITSTGTFSGRLFEHKAPKTVTNFVGLARGRRLFQDPETGEWVSRPFYDGLTFHRVSAGSFVVGGDPLANGRGGPGYAFGDELTPELRHDRPGILSMANAGPNTNGSQFIVTERPLPELDGAFPVFGALIGGMEVIRRIARAPLLNDQPVEPVVIQSVAFFRRKP